MQAEGFCPTRKLRRRSPPLTDGSELSRIAHARSFALAALFIVLGAKDYLSTQPTNGLEIAALIGGADAGRDTTTP
jgi:hypothetical protein